LLTPTQKRKRREYRLNRNATFTRPDPGFSLYEGRTRGKRLRYTFSDEEDFDSDNVGARRSTRTSGRETPAVPSGPTVTASGRQVRSRATGLYGETLLSGQVSDRASPATGDYVRSDASEEPQQAHAHGRSTRAANKSATNGRPSTRTTASDEEEDATSWDGGDEDEDEAEQMEVDEDEDEDGQGEDSSDNEEEPPTLMVTLRYGKGSSDDPASSTTSVPMAKDANGHVVPESDARLASHGASEQQIPAPVEPALPPTLLPHPVETLPPTQPQPIEHISNGVAAPMASATDSPAVVAKFGEMFAVPAPAYPVSGGQPAQQQPFPPTLPSPTPTSAWQ
jgi:hypothetical protein